MIQNFTYIDCIDLDRARVGGEPPASVNTATYDELTQFFGTFPLPSEVDLQFSIFHRFEILGEDDVRNVILHNNRILEPSPLIWVAIHGPSLASSRFAGSSRAFAPKSLHFFKPSEDCCDGVTPSPENKMGGLAYADRHQVTDAFASMPRLGYKHLLQIGQEGLIPDDFPWDPGFLNVWSSDPYNATTYRFCIQQ